MLSRGFLRRSLGCVVETRRGWRTPGVKGVQGMWGYYVVFPEIPDSEEIQEADAELRLNRDEVTGLPALDLTPEEALNNATRAAAAFDLHSSNLNFSLKEPGQAITFENSLGEWEQKSALAQAAWGVAKNLLLTAQPSDMEQRAMLALRADASKVEDMLGTTKHLAICNEYIIAAVRELAESSGLKPEQRRLVQRWLEDGEQWGRKVEDQQQSLVVEHQWLMLRHHSRVFTGNIAASLPIFDMRIQDPNELIEAPEAVVRLFAEKGADPYDGPWRIPLHPFGAHKYLLYGSNPHRRASVWQAINARSGFRQPTYNNSRHIEELRFMGKDIATTLGFDSFAHIRHQITMAASVENVEEFLDTFKVGLAPRWRELYADLNTFTHRNMADLKQRMRPHDVYYQTRRLAQSQHQLSTPKPLREYFPALTTWDNLLAYSSQLFGIEFRAMEADSFPSYHPSLRCYEVSDTESGELLGHLYWDPYFRAEKPSYTQAIPIQPRCDAAGMKPAVTLSTNLCGSSESPPLHWDELTELLYFFGQALRCLLTASPYPSIGGTETAEPDTREAVPQLFAALAHHPASLVRLSQGQSLPLEDAATASHCFMEVSLYELMRKAFLAEFDHRCWVSERPFWRDMYQTMWNEHFAGMEMWPEDVYPCTFTPIFTGPLRAVYYGKLWSHMIALDILQELEKATSEGREEEFGRRLRSELLCWGPLKPFHVQFQALMGRQPSLIPLLDFYELHRPEVHLPLEQKEPPELLGSAKSS